MLVRMHKKDIAQTHILSRTTNHHYAILFLPIFALLTPLKRDVAFTRYRWQLLVMVVELFAKDPTTTLDTHSTAAEIQAIQARKLQRERERGALANTPLRDAV